MSQDFEEALNTIISGNYATTVNYISDSDIANYFDTPSKPMQIEEPKGRSYLNDSKAIKKKLKPSWMVNADKQMKLSIKVKDEYTIKECLNCFEDLVEKDIGEIYLCGAVALYIQGKIKRDWFSDLDVIVIGKLTLDDDMHDNPYARKYNNKEFDRKAIIFEGVKIDFFNNLDCKPKFIDVEYSGKIYKCEHYHDIIKAKLDMVMNGFKDLNELENSSFKIEYL